MYLFSIEGGDGSGKGLATKIVAEILERDFAFASVEVTGEPRREHPLGRLAIDSVRQKKMPPEQEAGLFAADRLDHSHGWILPRLKEGRAVVSERNVHSSLVYQGLVGGLGVERVAHLNSASLIPDLCIWVDCDPKIAISRIRNETLRGVSNKEEYFETTKLQKKIRAGYEQLLSDDFQLPVPFDMGAVVGPILNEGSERDFRREITRVVRAFMHSRPNPVNVDMESVDRHMLRRLVRIYSGQSKLKEIGLDPSKNNSEWLGGNPPWKTLQISQKSHAKAIIESSDETIPTLPKNTLNHSITSICGT
ncbi:MAG TPA: dTMP kinase, partial [Candidatus Thalassarchaeaceae archaeon]|nr:dTMP kinase [Candidatus Thalassarchaeaceae archaeon]